MSPNRHIMFTCHLYKLLFVRNGVPMPNKRYALVVRLWQVKGDCSSPATTNPILTEPSHCYHWRGAVQLAGDTQLHYFNSLQEMNQLIARLVDSPQEVED